VRGRGDFNRLVGERRGRGGRPRPLESTAQEVETGVANSAVSSGRGSRREYELRRYEQVEINYS
jgi:hypothetical protein